LEQERKLPTAELVSADTVLEIAAAEKQKQDHKGQGEADQPAEEGVLYFSRAVFGVTHDLFL
jgi:hypothetical protein